MTLIQCQNEETPVQLQNKPITCSVSIKACFKTEALFVIINPVCLLLTQAFADRTDFARGTSLTPVPNPSHKHHNSYPVVICSYYRKDIGKAPDLHHVAGEAQVLLPGSTMSHLIDHQEKRASTVARLPSTISGKMPCAHWYGGSRKSKNPKPRAVRRGTQPMLSVCSGFCIKLKSISRYYSCLQLIHS